MKKLRHTSSILTATALSLSILSTSSYALEVTPLYGFRNGGEFIDETNNQQHTIDSSNMYG